MSDKVKQYHGQGTQNHQIAAKDAADMLKQLGYQAYVEDALITTNEIKRSFKVFNEEYDSCYIDWWLDSVDDTIHLTKLLKDLLEIQQRHGRLEGDSNRLSLMRKALDLDL